MKLLRVAFVGAVALLGVTCADFSSSSSSSSTEDDVVSGETNKGDLGLIDEGGSVHCGNRDEAKATMTSFAHGWAMTPARFAAHVGGQDFCPDTAEARIAELDRASHCTDSRTDNHDNHGEIATNTEHDDGEVSANTYDEDDADMTSATTSADDVIIIATSTLKGLSADASIADERSSNGDDDNDVELCGKLSSEGDLTSACLADGAIGDDTPTGTFEGTSADAASIDEPSNGNDDDISDDVELCGTLTDEGELPSPARPADDASGDYTPPPLFESMLRLQKHAWKDSAMRVLLERPVSGGEPASIQMTEVNAGGWLSRGTPRTKIVQLTPGTEVHAVSINSFSVSTSKGSWTFVTEHRNLRDLWMTALLYFTGQAADTAALDEPDFFPGSDSATPAAGNPFDVLDLQTSAKGMQPRALAVSGSALTMCKLTKNGRGTKSCQEVQLDSYSQAVPITSTQDKKGTTPTTRALFRVTTGTSPSAKSAKAARPGMWTFDAGSPKERARWTAAIKDVIREAKAKESEDVIVREKEDFEADDEDMPLFKERVIDPRYRGWSLGPGDAPLTPGQYLANPLHREDEPPVTLEVTELGDILVTLGHHLVPNQDQDKTTQEEQEQEQEQEPLWAYRATGSFRGGANGGLACVLEALWLRAIGEDVIEVNLSVKNGRWRVGRGAMCTLGRSPAPEGSLRRFLPWDRMGRLIKDGGLIVMSDGTVTISSGDTLLWHSVWES